MGVIKTTEEVKRVDLWNYIPEFYKCDCGKEIEKHIFQEDARYHVIHWVGKTPSGLNKDIKSERICSEEDCEINHKCEKKTLKSKVENRN